jgi:hypothetical protein
VNFVVNLTTYLEFSCFATALLVLLWKQQKCRFKHVGKIGMTTLKYDRATGRYFEASAIKSYEERRG